MSLLVLINHALALMGGKKPQSESRPLNALSETLTNDPLIETSTSANLIET